MKATHLAVIAFLSALSCGQPSTQDENPPAPPPSQRSSSGGGPAPSAGDPPPPQHSEDEDEEIVPAEKFSEGARSFAKVKDSLLQSYYAEGLSEDDLYRAATAGMLEKLEPRMKKWNRLYSPKEIAELKNDLKGEVVGIGINIKFDRASGYTDVLATIPGSPSQRAGLLAGDKIVTVNGKLHKGMGLRDVVAEIRGRAGEPVTLSVLRGDKLIGFTIARERVAYDQPSSAVIDGLGYVRIPSFNDKTPGEIRQALEGLAKENPKALVVDLRRNPGGSFERAVETAELFLPAGTAVVTLKRKGKAEERHLAKANGLLLELPLAVLVNEMTGSGAEFVSAALKDGRHARLIGQRTLGKWSVQSLDDLPNGYAFKYTVSLFRTPTGESFEGVGLKPDIEVAMTSADLGRAYVAKSDERLAVDVQLRTAKELLLRQ